MKNLIKTQSTIIREKISETDETISLSFENLHISIDKQTGEFNSECLQVICNTTELHFRIRTHSYTEVLKNLPKLRFTIVYKDEVIIRIQYYVDSFVGFTSLKSVTVNFI